MVCGTCIVCGGLCSVWGMCGVCVCVCGHV